MKLWGGRFRKGENKLMEEFNKSFGFDCVLYKKDIEGSLAHVYMQVQVGLLTEEEGKQITEGLQGILADIESGKLALSGDYEDIYYQLGITGTPYLMTEIDERYYVAEVDQANGIVGFDIADNMIVNVHKIFSCGSGNMDSIVRFYSAY